MRRPRIVRRRSELALLRDYIAIRDLSARYNRYADAADGAGHASLFTEDGVFAIRGTLFRGREEIERVVSATKNVVHITTDPIIEVSGDRATQASRIIAARIADDRQRVDFVATGTYFDKLVRTKAGWRFEERRGELDLDLGTAAERLGTQQPRQD